jgi:hypothetical protein
MGQISARKKAATVVVGLLAVVATAASGSEEATTSDGSEGGVSKGLGTSDASSDVTAPRLVREGEGDFQLVYGEVTITNNSSKRSDYFVTVAAESPDGATRIDETMVSVTGLEPGQKATEKGIFAKDVPADAVLRVLEVQRTASV